MLNVLLYKGISIILGELDMMKKFGFTLAEVLITLGIIGVVAALTAPALVQNAGTAKIGPTLSKVVATLENANEQLLHDEDATDLSKIAETNEEYCELLSKYIAGSSYNDDAVTFTPGATKWNDTASNVAWQYSKEFYFSDNISLVIGVYNSQNVGVYRAKGSFKGGYAYIYVDINGTKTKPNKFGKDIFLFFIDKSGQVTPAGSSTHAWLKNDDGEKYSSEGTRACNETTVGDGTGCAGSIFENNFKVIYQ